MTATADVRVRIAHHELPDRFRPNYLCRCDDVMIIITDPRSTQVEVVAWMIDNLAVAEQNVVRAAARGYRSASHSAITPWTGWRGCRSRC